MWKVLSAVFTVQEISVITFISRLCFFAINLFKYKSRLISISITLYVRFLQISAFFSHRIILYLYAKVNFHSHRKTKWGCRKIRQQAFPISSVRLFADRMYYILLDEVQMLDDFESVLNGLMRIENV